MGFAQGALQGRTVANAAQCAHRRIDAARGVIAFGGGFGGRITKSRLERRFERFP